MTVGPVNEAVSSSVGDIGGESSSRAVSLSPVPPIPLLLSSGKEENRAEGGSGGRSGSAERVRNVGVMPYGSDM